METYPTASLLLFAFILFEQRCSCTNFTGENIALRKPALQYPGTGYNGYARRAVDGITNPDYHAGSCTHTPEQNWGPAYWTVDLEGQYYITGVKIYNRDSNRFRLRQFKVYGYPGNVTLYDDASQTIKQYKKIVIDVVIDSVLKFRNITIYLPTVSGEKTILTLCEVQIFGGCLVPNFTNEIFYTGQGKHPVVSAGTSIQARCNIGYTLGNVVSTLTCGDKYTWDNEAPTCTAITCIPLTLGNGSYTYDQNKTGLTEKYSYDTKATPKCNKGFELELGEKRTCDAEGRWSGETDRCTIVTCDYPGILHHGYYTKNNEERYINGSLLYNSTINANCEEGYYLRSNQSRSTCSESGNWTGAIQMCDPVTCGFLNNTITANFSVTKETEYGYPYYGSVVLWTCIDDIGSDSTPVNQTCGSNGEWVGNIPPCQKLLKGLDDGPAIGLIAGVSVGIVAAVVLSALVAFIFIRRRHIPKENRDDTFAVNPTYVNNDITDMKELEPDLPEKSIDKTNKDYYDFTSTRKLPENAILLENLAEVVFGGDSVSDFESQYESLPKGLTRPHKCASKVENRPKNRYKNMYPYDDNRVVLDARMSSSNDYINASYINGFQQLRAYIATQGPMKNTLDDFWEMVWQTKCGKIVMLTNLLEKEKSKCEKYWPDSESRKFGDVTVRLLNAEIFSEFVVRMLEIHKEKGDKRRVNMFHFTNWPDKGVPKYASSLVHFRNKVKNSELSQKGPTIVHCSAGVGRTGTYIALDFLTDQAQALGYVAVADCVKEMRSQRINLVQTLDQYIFVHHALVEALMLSTSALPAAKFPDAYRELLQIDPLTKKRNLTLAFEMLRKMSPVQDEYQYVTAKDIENRQKNRFSNILPVAEYMPSLSGTGQQETDYINAVYLPTYKEKNAFIVTQLPLETTIPDFWRLVYEHDVHTIVMLNHISQVQEEEIYWPEDNQTKVYGNNEIRHLTTEKTGRHRCISMEMSTMNNTRTIKQFQCGNWRPDATVPDDPSTILLLLELVQAWQQQSGNHPILVHCLNGAERSGLYCVISAVLERMKIEQDVAISHVIEEMRNCREQVISSEVQFQFCHEAVVAFLEQYDTYSNFTA